MASGQMAKARADNMRRAYARDWDAFSCWCATLGRPALPASADTLALYLTHLADRGLRHSTKVATKQLAQVRVVLDVHRGPPIAPGTR
jgi:hypothetical protein